MMKFPRWLSWIVLIGLAWLLYVGNTRAPEVTSVSATKEGTTVNSAPKRYREIEALFDGERWKKGMFPDYESARDACSIDAPQQGKLHAYALELAPGSGDGVLACGDIASMRIARRNSDGSEGKANDVTLTLGEQKGLDGLLLGMREGEHRLLIVNLPAKLRTLPTLPADTQLLLDVTRVSATPSAAASADATAPE